jgi:hypothetical protein
VGGASLVLWFWSTEPTGGLQPRPQESKSTRIESCDHLASSTPRSLRLNIAVSRRPRSTLSRNQAECRSALPARPAWRRCAAMRFAHFGAVTTRACLWHSLAPRRSGLCSRWRAATNRERCSQEPFPRPSVAVRPVPAARVRLFLPSAARGRTVSRSRTPLQDQFSAKACGGGTAHPGSAASQWRHQWH